MLRWSGETGINEEPYWVLVAPACSSSEHVSGANDSSDEDTDGGGVSQGVVTPVIGSIIFSSLYSSKNPISSKIPLSSASLTLVMVMVDRSSGASNDDTGPIDGIIERIVSEDKSAMFLPVFGGFPMLCNVYLVLVSAL